MHRKRIALLGATGSIGKQTLDIVRSNPELFEVTVLAAGSNWQALAEAALEFRPHRVVIADDEAYKPLREHLEGSGIVVSSGEEEIAEAARGENVDIVVAAIVGVAGLRSTIAALSEAKTVALANKESLVVAGELVSKLLKLYGGQIIPVDSEHSAIYQCLVGETSAPEKILLTASGGPFRGFSKEQLKQVRLDEALKHPNWSMGPKVTIDSASMMNKGLEMIEAHWLFGIPSSQIEVLIHPQSIVHSLVQFVDGSVKAQLGLPDMRLPIGYAIGLRERLPNDYARLDLTQKPLDFYKPDLETFPNLRLAYEAIQSSDKSKTTILNAANEVAVSKLLAGQISFHQLSWFVEEALQKLSFPSPESLEDYLAIDRATRQWVSKLI